MLTLCLLYNRLTHPHTRTHCAETVPLSQPARAVLWACAASGTEHEMITTMPGSNKEGGSRHPDFTAK